MVKIVKTSRFNHPSALFSYQKPKSRSQFSLELFIDMPRVIRKFEIVNSNLYLKELRRN